MLMWPPPPQSLHNTHNGKPAIPHTFCPEENVMQGGVWGGKDKHVKDASRWHGCWVPATEMQGEQNKPLTAVNVPQMDKGRRHGNYTRPDLLLTSSTRNFCWLSTDMMLPVSQGCPPPCGYIMVWFMITARRSPSCLNCCKRKKHTKSIRYMHCYSKHLVGH